MARNGTAYLTGIITVYPVGKPTRRWEARDRWKHLVASGSTRKECERNTRLAEYTPVRGRNPG